MTGLDCILDKVKIHDKSKRRWFISQPCTMYTQQWFVRYMREVIFDL